MKQIEHLIDRIISRVSMPLREVDFDVTPHTIIALDEPLDIPDGFIGWGYTRNRADHICISHE